MVEGRALDRRSAVATVLTSVTGVALLEHAHGGRVALAQRRGRAIVQRGIVGGGITRFAGSDAQFSLFASRLIFAGEAQEVVAGSLLWVDAPAGLTLTSTAVTEYRVLEVPPERGQARELIGTMRVNGAGAYPFSAVVIDAGPPGSGLDTVSLTVGDGGFTYTAVAATIIGDVHLIDLEEVRRAPRRRRRRNR